jgi:hypothetical protein
MRNVEKPGKKKMESQAMRQDATNEPHHHGSCIICIYSDFQAELSYYVW